MYQRFANKRVLIIPLNWGLGHATRCVPIIEKLIEVGALLTISGSGDSGCYLKQKFNQISYLPNCPDYHVHYPNSGVSFWKMMKQWPKLERAIRAEQQWLATVMQTQDFDFILSDHRFGIFGHNSYNIFISHQLNPILPFGWKQLFRLSQSLKLRPFDEVWIPDLDAPSDLSGALSDYSGPQLIKRIGWISRFQNVEEIAFESYEWVGWVSGPETQRTCFENQLQSLFENSGKKCLLICGQPQLKFDTIVNGVRRVSHLEEGEMKFVIQRASKCFSRSGYSSLMDLKVLNTDAELFPTPGQTEQIYLANRWKSFC